ncbi:MAG TPA: terminase small subunit [Terriglobales bacterium]|nr:terminase small subunit [Terriglobales bacterium]
MGKSADILSAREAAFVLHYQGNAREAALKAGYSAKSADRTAQFLLGRPSVQAALRRKQEAVLAVMEQSGRNMGHAFVAQGLTPDFIARKLKEVLDSPPHPQRGWIDHIATLKLVIEILGLARRKPAPEDNQPEISEDGRFLIYRPNRRRELGRG